MPETMAENRNTIGISTLLHHGLALTEPKMKPTYPCSRNADGMPMMVMNFPAWRRSAAPLGEMSVAPRSASGECSRASPFSLPRPEHEVLAVVEPDFQQQHHHQVPGVDEAEHGHGRVQVGRQEDLEGALRDGPGGPAAAAARRSETPARSAATAGRSAAPPCTLKTRSSDARMKAPATSPVRYG